MSDPDPFDELAAEPWMADGEATMTTRRVCTIEDCSEPHEARGFCRNHYKRWRRWGTPHGRRPTYIERFIARVDRRGPDDCWPWTGKTMSRGYGVCYSGKELAHRVTYRLAKGEIPDGFDIDHTCHNDSSCAGGICEHRLCCNPAHLEAVEPLTNRLRSHLHNAAKTHCQAGHAYDEANTYRYVKPNGQASRRCRQCARDHDKIRATRKSKRVVLLRPCGTEAAYKRHLRNGEPTCPKCRAAHAVVTAARRRRVDLRREGQVA